MPNLFVYGTLKRGYHNHRLLADAIFEGEYEAHGFSLLDFGAFPGMIDGPGSVHGEVYQITKEMLPALDRLEGVPTLYERRSIYIHKGGDGFKCYAYIFKPMMDLKEYQIIESGRWEKKPRFSDGRPGGFGGW